MQHTACSLRGRGAWTTLALVVTLGCDHTGAGATRDTSTTSGVATHDTKTGIPRDTTVPADSIRQPRAPLVARPPAVRGLYVNRWAALGQ